MEGGVEETVFSNPLIVDIIIEHLHHRELKILRGINRTFYDLSSERVKANYILIVNCATLNSNKYNQLKNENKNVVTCEEILALHAQNGQWGISSFVIKELGLFDKHVIKMLTKVGPWIKDLHVIKITKKGIVRLMKFLSSQLQNTQKISFEDFEIEDTIGDCGFQLNRNIVSIKFRNQEQLPDEFCMSLIKKCPSLCNLEIYGDFIWTDLLDTPSLIQKIKSLGVGCVTVDDNWSWKTLIHFATDWKLSLKELKVENIMLEDVWEFILTQMQLESLHIKIFDYASRFPIYGPQFTNSFQNVASLQLLRQATLPICFPLHLLKGLKNLCRLELYFIVLSGTLNNYIGMASVDTELKQVDTLKVEMRDRKYKVGLILQFFPKLAELCILDLPIGQLSSVWIMRSKVCRLSLVLKIDEIKNKLDSAFVGQHVSILRQSSLEDLSITFKMGMCYVEPASKLTDDFVWKGIQMLSRLVRFQVFQTHGDMVSISQLSHASKVLLFQKFRVSFPEVSENVEQQHKIFQNLVCTVV